MGGREGGRGGGREGEEGGEEEGRERREGGWRGWAYNRSKNEIRRKEWR